MAKKLHLNLETLRLLNPETILHVHGGDGRPDTGTETDTIDPVRTNQANSQQVSGCVRC